MAEKEGRKLASQGKKNQDQAATININSTLKILKHLERSICPGHPWTNAGTQREPGIRDCLPVATGGGEEEVIKEPDKETTS